MLTSPVSISQSTLTRQDKTRQELSGKIHAAQERLGLYEEELQFRRTVLQYEAESEQG